MLPARGNCERLGKGLETRLRETKEREERAQERRKALAEDPFAAVERQRVRLDRVQRRFDEKRLEHEACNQKS